MLIQLNDKFRIRTFDDKNLVLEEKYLTEDKNEMWKINGYFGKLDHIIERVLYLGINRSEVSTVIDIKRHIDNAVEDICCCIEKNIN